MLVLQQGVIESYPRQIKVKYRKISLEWSSPLIILTLHSWKIDKRNINRRMILQNIQEIP